MKTIGLQSWPPTRCTVAGVGWAANGKCELKRVVSLAATVLVIALALVPFLAVVIAMRWRPLDYD
jgi:hypothetical protein